MTARFRHRHSPPTHAARSRHGPFSRIGAAVILLAIGATLPASALALTIKSIVVSRHPLKGDAFTIKGAFDPGEDLPLATAGTIVFELDGTLAGLPTNALKRSRTQLSFKGPRGAPGVTRLVVDLKKRRFSAKGIGVLLPNLVPGPLVTRLEADGVTACAVLPLQRLGKPPRGPPAKPKTIRYGLPKEVTATPCLLARRLRAHPRAVVIDVPTSVRFEAVLAAGITVVPGSVAVRQLDGTGLPSGPPVCTLVDDGSEASGDLVAGDGLSACTTTLTEPAIGTLAFVIEATVGAATLRSLPLRLPIVAPLTDADVTAMFAAQDEARSIWNEVAGTLGDTVNARRAALERIALLPGVAEAALSPNGFDIGIRFTSGHTGGLMLSSRFDDPAAPVATLAGVAPSAATRASAMPHVRAAIGVCSTDPERTVIGNRKALILKTSYFGIADDAPIAAAALSGSCLPIEVETGDLTPAALLGIAPYATVYFSTHGYLDADGEIGILTELTATAAEVLAAGPLLDPFSKHEAFIVGLPAITGGNRNVWVVRPAFLRRVAGTLDHGLVYASHCHGADDPAEAAAFFKKGARSFFGFNRVVSYNFARLSTSALLPALAQRLLTTREAYAPALKIDPTPFHGNPLAKGLAYVRQAPAALRLLGDEHLAYVGTPTVAPPSSTITTSESVALTVDVPRKNDCELVHRWTTTTRAGELSDSQGHKGGLFDSTDVTTTYTPFGDRTGADNQVISVRAPTPNGGAAPPFFGYACATIEVSGCGDGVIEGGEECDGADAAACPGACLGDCTCRRDPRCGNDVKEHGEICDGTDRDLCDAAHVSGVGYCFPDCSGCGACGDGETQPNEECDFNDPSPPCPNACRINCTCGCTPGDPAGCPGNQCCDQFSKNCCTPVRHNSDPVCFATASGCCGGGVLQPNICGPGGPSPAVCPSANDCLTGDYYWCLYCDNKLVQGFCNIDTGCAD